MQFAQKLFLLHVHRTLVTVLLGDGDGDGHLRDVLAICSKTNLLHVHRTLVTMLLGE